MKAKKFSKKLMLNKKTIAHLNSNEMKGVNGGKLIESIDYCLYTVGPICSHVIPC